MVFIVIEKVKKVVFEDSIVERDTPYSWDMSVAQDEFK